MARGEYNANPRGDNRRYVGGNGQEAVVIENNCGRKVPDIYATGVSEDPKHGTDLKMQQAHAKKIHNDIYRRYGQDSPEDDPF